MQVTNMTLVITDPCYIKNNFHAHPLINEGTIYGDWSCFCYKGKKEECKQFIDEWDEFYFDFFHKYNFTGKTEEEKKVLAEEFKQKQEEFVKEHTFGQFCADSGRVAVYDYRQLTEENKKWVAEHPWCACLVPDYTGEVKYVVEREIDENGKAHESAHIVGDNFYTSQSGM